MKAETIKHLCAALLYLTLAVCAVIVSVRAIKVADTFETKASVLLTTSTSTAQQAQAILKQFKEESQEPETVLARRNAFRIGTETLALLSRFQRDTLPKLNEAITTLEQTAQTSRAMIERSDARINNELLPETTKLISSINKTADAIGIEASDVLKAVRATAEKSNKSIEEINALLASPEWLATLRNLDAATKESARGMTALANAAESADAGLQELPPQMKAVREILQRGSKYQRISLLVSLFGNALGVWSAIR